MAPPLPLTPRPTSSPIDFLPSEVLLTIFSYLSKPQDLCSSERTSKRFRTILSSHPDGTSCWIGLIVNKLILPNDQRGGGGDDGDVEEEDKDIRLSFRKELEGNVTLPSPPEEEEERGRAGAEAVKEAKTILKQLFFYSSVAANGSSSRGIVQFTQPLYFRLQHYTHTILSDVNVNVPNRTLRLLPEASYNDDRAVIGDCGYRCFSYRRGTPKLIPVFSSCSTMAEGVLGGGRKKKWILSTDTPFYFEIQVLPSSSSTSQTTTAGGGGRQRRESSTNRASVDSRRRRLVRINEPECLSLGLGTSRFPLRGAQPGWRSSSIGYHGDDGRCYVGSGGGYPFGPKFGKVGDVVGCGLDYTTGDDGSVDGGTEGGEGGEVFFTLNGKFLGVGCNGVEKGSILYPLMGVGTHATVRWNFGSEEFAYDVLNHRRCKAEAEAAERDEAIVGGNNGNNIAFSRTPRPFRGPGWRIRALHEAMEEEVRRAAAWRNGSGVVGGDEDAQRPGAGLEEFLDPDDVILAREWARGLGLRGFDSDDEDEISSTATSGVGGDDDDENDDDEDGSWMSVGVIGDDDFMHEDDDEEDEEVDIDAEEDHIEEDQEEDIDAEEDEMDNELSEDEEGSGSEDDNNSDSDASSLLFSEDDGDDKGNNRSE